MTIARGDATSVAVAAAATIGAAAAGTGAGADTTGVTTAAVDAWAASRAASRSRAVRSNTFGLAVHGAGDSTCSTESQSGVEAGNGGPGTRFTSGEVSGTVRWVKRTGMTRLRHASNTSGAAIR